MSGRWAGMQVRDARWRAGRGPREQMAEGRRAAGWKRRAAAAHDGRDYGTSNLLLVRSRADATRAGGDDAAGSFLRITPSAFTTTRLQGRPPVRLTMPSPNTEQEHLKLGSATETSARLMVGTTCRCLLLTSRATRVYTACVSAQGIGALPRSPPPSVAAEITACATQPTSSSIERVLHACRVAAPEPKMYDHHNSLLAPAPYPHAHRPPHPA